MNEQEISRAVRAVLEQLGERTPGQKGAGGSDLPCPQDQKREPQKADSRCMPGENTPAMTLDAANELIEKVKARAAAVGVNAVVAVSDAAGRPISVQCMDGAYIASFDIALNKTYTSAGLKMPTSALAKLAAPGGSLYGIQHTNGGRIVIFGGGEVLEKNGRIVGALGVSGGTAQQDTALGAYGKKVFEEEM